MKQFLVLVPFVVDAENKDQAVELVYDSLPEYKPWADPHIEVKVESIQVFPKIGTA